ncbi:Dienelactone hydrolase [Paraburkholderia caribensis MBA4]|uniref:Dienelactone hydrolase n=1 Tax=Paraburkholderia caribensis MBA4 TaxID=1323664 RepID=A0A0P0RI06_9BURK|nr:dienelactone hydrolase family protein [Paraburkholderia caribensis]ALL68427.1 Dienelactone hydrolase [Paraburkholderia caribensis MBA4]
MEFSSRWIDIPAHDGGHFQGYLALPPGGTGPGLLVLQEIFGVNAHIRGVAEQYAAQGYVVLAPDLFWRTSPRLEIGYHGVERVRANELYDQMDKDLALADVSSAAAQLRTLPEIRGKVAAVGFCLGGWLTYAAAAAHVIDIGVSYYGGGIQDALHLADDIVAPMQFHFGEIDPHVPITIASQLRTAFEGRDAEVHTYPEADHGFNCWERETYHPASATLAHERALRFLDQHDLRSMGSAR